MFSFILFLLSPYFSGIFATDIQLVTNVGERGLSSTNMGEHEFGFKETVLFRQARYVWCIAVHFGWNVLQRHACPI
ncbi:hypothetical protein BDP27DRAFT_1349621 [Rhodocollybia butyracea]|uniref:Secreted protein n=1 Tax=Rhodocollybia butyracea TaxID=206335 RepID=A0A9P5TWZ8_9AGAR|nr:hypothetical protein BDP27DRAFT_1349621 [Rhodocollybia butyracea]